MAQISGCLILGISFKLHEINVTYCFSVPSLPANRDQQNNFLLNQRIHLLLSDHIR